jgi:hypothetical protein
MGYHKRHGERKETLNGYNLFKNPKELCRLQLLGRKS